MFPCCAPLGDLTVVTDFVTLLQGAGLDSLGALFTVDRGVSLTKPGLDPWRERIRLTLSSPHGEQVLFLKRFTAPPARIRREVRRSASAARSVAGVEWTWLHRLAAADIPCAQPVAFGEELAGSRERRSAVLMSAVPGRSLEVWANAEPAPDRRTVLHLLAGTAALVSKLHRAGYAHRDLYLSHLFVEDTEPEAPVVHLIDLQRVRHFAEVPRRWIVKDLAALNYSTPPHLATRAGRLRWLKRYLGVSKLDTVARRLAFRVIGKTARMARHDGRRR
ncbi:MAG: hypothetical protein HY763_01295 [Planctomycetes bacterium]|nr:hypothetical protein [Planctomycetota bacterium]